jgi:hypothetical protein
MKKNKFLSIVLTIIITVSTSFAGCSSQDKLELLNALEKSEKMISWESTSQIRFTNVTFDTNIEDLLVLQLFIPLLDNLNFETNQKTIQNSERTIIKSQADTKMNAEGLTEQTMQWIDYDFVQQPPVARQIIKLSETVAASLPEDLAGKEYVIIDQSELPLKETMSSQDYIDMMESMNNFRSNLVQLLKEHALYKDPDFVVIKQLKHQVVDGEKMSLYQLKLDDSSFKTVLKYALAELSENEQVKEAIKELISLISITAEGTEGALDLDMAYDVLTNGDAQLKDEVDLIMAALDDVEMLGSRGIELNFLINKDGYIVNQNGVFDFYIDSQQLEDAFEELAKDTEYDGKEIYKFTFGIAMEFNTDISKINQAVNIEFPVITEANSFDFNDFAGIAPSFGRKIMNQGNRAVKLDFSSTSREGVFPVKLGNNSFIPLEPVSKKLGLKLEAKKNGEFVISTGKGNIKGKAGSTEITVDDKQQYLPFPVMRIENQLFVPDQFVKQYLNTGIYYDEETKVLIIQKNR